MRSSEGFPDRSKFTSVPNLLFGSLLEEIDDLLVLKCLLRILWLHSQKKGFPRFLTWHELVDDRTITKFLSSNDYLLDAMLSETLEKTRCLGLLIHTKMDTGQGIVDIYIPNNQEGRRAAKYIDTHKIDTPSYKDHESLERTAMSESRPNIFHLYEENIGIIGHIMAEELKLAEEVYPQEWLEKAFREAVVHNKRSWRYIETILKGWMTEGIENGESGRHSEKIDAREWIRRHGLPRSSR